ncbi:biotin/lipoyl-containing protein [Pelosinus propionicus]|uniref:Biotin-requiring enzyme n=1 Tax=Pelosinus propionicus DSM 13327 TaxID=1123291 RepID=A0A1I4JNV2_9FIRM|nr:biotin/lipoyl-containing protein [Pelosinus propionicus]SFL68212.1 Biotin-requiring enzyme [Pelosinus propionicus DSM 13327]
MKKFNITVNGTAYQVEVEEVKEAKAVAAPAAKPAAAPAAPKAAPVAAAAPAAAEVGAGETGVPSPMPGKIVKVLAQAGQAVKKGDVLLILEAMKMQNEITAPVDGTVKSINVAADQSVKPNEVLAVIK